jgi:hypothetical protein
MAPLTSLARLHKARDVAISYKTNPANFEHNWYPFWNLVSMRMASRISLTDCYIAPQYPLWLLCVKGQPGIEPEAIFQVFLDTDSDNKEGGPLASDDSFEKDPTWVPPSRKNVDVEMKGAPVKGCQRVIRKYDGGDATMGAEQDTDTSFLPDGDRSMESNTTTTGNAWKRITDFALIVWEGAEYRVAGEGGDGHEVDDDDEGISRNTGEELAVWGQDILLPAPEPGAKPREQVVILCILKN